MWNIFTGLNWFLITAIIISIFIYLSKPRSYWALASGLVFGTFMFYMVGIYSNFVGIALTPAQDYLIYGGTLTFYTISSLMIFAGLTLMGFVALLNIYNSWNSTAIRIWQ